MAAIKVIEVHGVRVHVFKESIMVNAVTFGRRAGNTLMGDDQIISFVSALLKEGARMNQNKIKSVLGIK